MRQFSTAVQTVLDSDLIEYAFLIKLSFNSTYYLTSNSYDVDYGENTYLANSGLYSFDNPKFSAVVDRESYKIVISEILDEMLPEFKLNVVGKPIEVFVALRDASGDLLLSTGDVLKVYKGTVDKPSISNDFEEKLAVLEGTSPMSDLDLVRNFISSKDGMDQKSGTDTSFDEIYDGNEITIKWGKV
ncbi:hypothetical protein OAD54_01385 [Candidatus Pelagibacter sp.]|nr:hypothetical protein [Candidatus Pelagibacter sp.]